MSDPADPTAPDDFDAEIAKMLGHIEEYKEKEYQRLKTDHDRLYGSQGDLFGEIDGLKLDDVRHYLLQLLILEEVLGTVTDSRNTVFQVMKEKRLPVRTVKAALKIAKSRAKRDSSVEVLDACVRVAEVLLAQQTGTTGMDPETGEIRE